MTLHRLFDRRSALIVIFSGRAATVHSTHASEAAASVLAPTGRLRIAVFAGSPISFVEDARTGERRGVPSIHSSKLDCAVRRRPTDTDGLAADVHSMRQRLTLEKLQSRGHGEIWKLRTSL